MNAHRRSVVKWLPVLAATPLGAWAQTGSAESYPSKTIRIVVPYPAGGLNDRLARLLATGFTKKWGQPVVVENRGGGNTVPATAFVAKSSPDGHTLYVNTPTPWSVNTAYYDSLPYGRNDYTAIASLTDVPLGVYVPMDSPFKTLADLVNYAKTNPGKLNVGSGGALTGGALAMELFKQVVGVDIVAIPFQGGNPAILALLGGHVQLMFNDIAGATPYIQAGKLRVLAVSMTRRLPTLPDVPTFAESGFGHVQIPGAWIGLFGPPGMPKTLVDKINTEANVIMQSADGLQLINGSALVPAVNSTERARALTQEEIDTFGPLIKKLGLKSKES